MPSAELSFEKKDVEGSPSNHYGVQGILMLVVLRPISTVAVAYDHGRVRSGGGVALALTARGAPRRAGM